MSYFNIILPDLNDFSINPSFSRYVMCDSVSPIPKYFLKSRLIPMVVLSFHSIFDANCKYSILYFLIVEGRCSFNNYIVYNSKG